MAEQCRECGASGRWGSCDQLFMSLLALDHERKQPWGSWHALNVACYLLQHPSRSVNSALAGQWEMVQTFLSGGLDAVRVKTEEAVRQNSHRRSGPDGRADSAPALVEKPGVTIENVSVDGSFPPDDYSTRMEKWIRSVAASRGVNS